MLILVPTCTEAAHLFDGPSPEGARPVRTRVGTHAVRAALTGFGPIAAAALGALALGERDGETVCLAGMAGTYRPRVLPVGGLLVATEAVSADVGRGRGDAFLGPRALGLPQVPASGSAPAIYDRLPLALPGPTRLVEAVRGQVLTVARASGSADEAARCRAAHPEALAEEMEGFAVALAASRFEVPLLLLRGISNVAGEADRTTWRVGDALASVRGALEELLA